MTSSDLPPKLYLVVPWDLPVEQQLDDVCKAKVERSLKQFFLALEQDSDREAIALVRQEIANLDVSSATPAKFDSSQTFLAPEAIEEFDDYFEILHVQTQEPAICIVWSFLVAYQAFLDLNERTSNFDPECVALQTQGFTSYARMLARVFHLDLE